LLIVSMNMLLILGNTRFIQILIMSYYKDKEECEKHKDL
jgi:hypothetical protein